MERKILNKERIEKAKEILCQMFKVNKTYLENNTCRKKNVMEARRFFIYYIRNELYITYSGISNFIEGLHHSTAIYHCRKFEDLLKYEKPLRDKYHKFIVLANDFDVLATLLSIKRTQCQYLNLELKELNGLLTQKRIDEQSKIIKNQYKL
tara:strand:+ start:2399 stop:2851 length:453 start_codon:yes stop_codon:yes gene_type:complete